MKNFQVLVLDRLTYKKSELKEYCFKSPKTNRIIDRSVGIFLNFIDEQLFHQEALQSGSHILKTEKK